MILCTYSFINYLFFFDLLLGPFFFLLCTFIACNIKLCNNYPYPSVLNRYYICICMYALCNILKYIYIYCGGICYIIFGFRVAVITYEYIFYLICVLLSVSAAFMFNILILHLSVSWFYVQRVLNCISSEVTFIILLSRQLHTANEDLLI